MNFLTGLIVIVVLTVGAVEFGVWIMKGMLGGDGEHHASRTPVARIVGYVIGGVALVAFIMLATGGAGFWPIVVVVFGIPLALMLVYRKPAALGD